MKKAIAFILMAILVLSMLAGCGTKTAGTAGGAEKSPEGYNGEITMWTWYSDWLKQWVGEFNKAYPNIKVKIVEYSYDDYFSKLRTALSGGGGAPDVIELEDGQIAWLVASGKLEDLSKAPYNAEKSLFVDYEVPSFINDKGEFVALPEGCGPAGIWYNRTVVKEYLGTDDPAEVSKIIGSGEPGYDKFIAAMKQIVDKSGGKVKGVQTLAEVYKMMKGQKGKGYFDGNKIVFEELFKEDFKVIERIAKEGLSAKLGDSSTEPWLAAFKNDSVAFFPGACWYRGYYIAVDDENKGKWGFVVPPVSGFDSGSQGTGIWKDSKKKELAWQWLKWFNMSEEGQIAQWNVGAVPPVLKSAYNNPKLQEVDPVTNQKLGEVFFDITKTAPQVIRTKDDSAVSDQVDTVMISMEEGKLTAEEALKTVVDEALKRLKDFSRP